MNTVVQEDTVLRLERLIAAPPERVFELWTEPELFTKWFGPEGYDIPNHRCDLRPGGAWHSTMRTPDGKTMGVGGVYRAIEPPRRLVFTWAWDQADGTRGHETEVTVTLDPTPGGTRLRLVHQTFETRDGRDSHNKGWTSTLSKLERFART